MNLLEYLGKFHPLLVHLPIGILSLFLLLSVLIPRKELLNSIIILRITLLASAFAATFSSISGFILMNTGSYSGNLVTGHQVMGILLTLINWLVWFRLNFILSRSLLVYRLSLGIILVLMILTGHAGGSLTHGSDFLVPPSPSAWFDTKEKSDQLIDLNTNAYQAAHLILEKKCVVCHGPNKQKGALRLDGQEGFLTGGKTGNLLGENGTSGLLIQRIILPLDDEEHMPPAERKQLTRDEIDFLTWWIENGADFERTLSELNFPDSISGLLSTVEVPDPFIPSEEVDHADIVELDELRNLGVVINPIAKDSPYLSANFINVLDENYNEAISGLSIIKEQLVFLYVDDRQITNGLWGTIGHLTQLRKLSMRNNILNSENLAHLSELKNLVSLNLVGTKVSMQDLKSITGLTNLKYLYLYQTGLSSEDFTQISKLFPQTSIDTGNYQVPILASDTTVLRLER